MPVISNKDENHKILVIGTTKFIHCLINKIHYDMTIETTHHTVQGAILPNLSKSLKKPTQFHDF